MSEVYLCIAIIFAGVAIATSLTDIARALHNIHERMGNIQMNTNTYIRYADEASQANTNTESKTR